MREITASQAREDSRCPRNGCKSRTDRPVQQLANSITSLNASVTIQLTAGSSYQGVIQQYHEVNGFILAQKPSDIRVIGQVPIVGKNIFDMESDGKVFHIFIPSKNQFLVGPADLESPFVKAHRKSAAAASERRNFLGAHSKGRSGASGGDHDPSFQLLRADGRPDARASQRGPHQCPARRGLGDRPKNMV